MSEIKPITPLLADHILGEAISCHHGIRCCPAMHNQTGEKYIVKILSIPASASQLDALLLSGAYQTKEEALQYYRRMADDAVKEAQLLQKLSALEGFCGYEGWQVQPRDDGTGYEVYLLAGYRTTLERYLRRNTMTHLAAVNLGLDLCAALSVCRRNGYIYVDVKPENIVLSDAHGYLIGDIGFISQRSLKYASLPDKYRSAYTAPEITDAYSTLNTTVDIYAVGMVLWQVFNGGALPTDPLQLESPAYADYDMAQIILKACHPDPDQRWQDPQQMGQALVSYMQRNTVNDTPIIPVAELPAEEEIPAADELPTDEEVPVAQENPAEAEPPAAEEIPAEDAPAAEEPVLPIVEETDNSDPVSEPEVEHSEEINASEEPAVEEGPSKPEAVEEPVLAAPEAAEEPVSAEPETAEEDEPEQFVIDGFLFDDELDEEEAAALTDAVLSEEVSQMLAQADELIAHKAPDPVVSPEPVEIPMPEPIVLYTEPVAGEVPAEEVPAEESPAEPAEEAPAEETPTEPAEQEPAAQEMAGEEESDEEASILPAKKPRRKGLGCLIVLLIAVLLGLFGYHAAKYYYETEYLQHIDSINLLSAEDWLVVQLSTDIDNSLLSVSCTDTYGIKLTQPVADNKATFTSLPSGASYKITVEISGRHKLTGQTSANHTTASQTSIIGFNAIAGDSDGAVILNFSVQGPDGTWLVEYFADGIPAQTAPCSGHMAIITGLEVGKEYTFRLVPQEELYVVSGNELTFTAAAVVYAQNLAIHGFENGALIASWELPEGMEVASWTVRCYNSTGYDETFTVTEPTISIPDLDISQGYTVDVKAEGMTVGKWTSISVNSITFKNILVDNSDPSRLILTWPYEGTVPEGGWQLRYSVDGSESVVIPCEKNTCTLTDLIPGGTYSFSFVLPDDITVYGGTAQCTVANVGLFSGYQVSANNMLVRMCKAPAASNWDHSDVAQDAYTTDFILGDSAGFVIRLYTEYVTSPDEIKVTYIIRDSSGTLCSADTYTQTWTNLWYQGYCELNLPQLPQIAGSYTVQILFNNAYVTTEPISFTLSAQQTDSAEAPTE